MKTLTLTLIGLVCFYGASLTEAVGTDEQTGSELKVEEDPPAPHSYCQSSITNVCKNVKDATSNCTAGFGKGFDLKIVADETQNVIEHKLKYSLEYLLMSSHFGEWNINRKGFQNYFAKLSDDSWDDAVALTQHFIKRGGRLHGKFGFNMTRSGIAQEVKHKYGELFALSKALDNERHVADKYLGLIHLKDAEFAHFLADEISDKQVLRIKHLSNHVNSLNNARKSTEDSSFVFYLYDTQVLN